jgi:hypothetical protein
MLAENKMFSHCEYCKEKFEWTGKDYHLLIPNGFCSAECGNRFHIARNEPYRFCTNPDCGNVFKSRNVTTDKCTFCQAEL